MYSNKVFVSSKRQKNQLQKVSSLKFEYNPDAEMRVLNIYPELKYQKIQGFGGAFTESSAANYDKMSEKVKNKVIELLFDRKKGLAYNFCRTSINSCDFSEKEYCYVDKNDKTLESFDISNDKKQIIPMIKDAMSVAQDKMFVFSSPWSPCDWMKDTEKMIEGGKLRADMYSTWAKYYVKYIKAYEECGIKISALTVQNEPMAAQTWESCVYTSEEQILFARDFLYPALQESGLSNVKIMIWDHNKEHVYDWAREMKNIKGSEKCIWGIAFHWYSGEHFDALKFAHEIVPKANLVSTEFCFGGVKPDWMNAERYAYDMIGNFNNHTVASCDWNLILDEKGGPHHARDGGCKAIIHYDTKKDSLIVMPHYYAVAHFSKFVRRGAVRLGTTKYSKNVDICAFQNPNGKIVAVILCRADQGQSCLLRLNNYSANIELKPHSITTIVIKKDEIKI